MKLKNLGLLLLAAWAASSCGEEPRAPVAEPAPAAVRTTRQEARSTNKVLILDSSVNGGLGSREALAVKSFAPTAQITVATPAAWRAMTAEEFMLYRTIIIGDAACESGTAAFQAAVDTRRTWGAIIDGDVALLSTDPTHNNTGDLVENAIKFVLRSAQYRTGMYIALGCAYQDAPADTAVPLLEPFGDFKVEGVPGCADSGHMFEMSPPALSSGIFDGVLVGNGCAARSVFTSYPEHTFAHAAIATSSSGAVIPGQQTYIDYLVEPGQETPFVGAPYLLVKGAMALGAGCGDLDNNPPEEECDAGDGTNGQPAPPGQDPLQTCSFSCHLNWCGDGVVDAAFGEECDNGVNNGRTGDAAGNIGACSGFCRIPNIPPPNRPPMAVCRDVTVAATNTCGVPADINNGSSDPDGDPVSCVQNPPGPYGIGTTMVTLACSDPQGQFGTCTGTVTVTDQVAPTVTLEGPANEALECTRGDTYPDQGATANDVCEGPLPVTSSGSVNMGTPGSYALTYSATDAAGNVGTATRTVLVSDTLPPTLTLAGANPLVHECSVPFNDPGSSATDQCAGILPVTRTGSVDIMAPGPNTLTYSVNDGSGHTASQDRAVNVSDTLPPAVTINGPLTLQLECRGGPYTELGATASDACAGSLTAVPTDTADPNVVGTYTIGYRAVDPSGNVGTSSNNRVVTVSDTLAPVLTLEGANPQTLECGTAWVSPGATANDQCVGSRTAAVTVSGTVNDRVLDTYTVTYSVSDGNGNTQTQDRTVNVNDTLAPAITVQGPLNDTAECGSNYVDPSARANDVCAGLVPVTATRTGNTSRPGTLTISYTATDPSGNSVTSADTRTVMVSDTQLPTLELVGAATQRLECGTAYNEQGVRANDVCFGDLSSSVTTTGSVSSGTPGDYTLVYDVTDGAGNRAPSVSRTVEVRDTLAPILTVRAPLNPQVECDHLPYEDPGATATDICAGDLTGAIQRTGSVDTGTPGDYSLSYQVTDPSGNEATAAGGRTVTVVDTVPPILRLVGSASAGHECGAAYDDPGATANDVCAGDLTGNITRTGTVNPAVLGDYTVLYTVADPSNRTASTQRTVTVSDTLAPVLTLEGANPQTLECGTAWVSPGATANDQCAGPRTAAITVSGTVNDRVLDTYTVTYSVSDGNGNTQTQDRAVNVNDTLAPAITVQGPLNDTAECGSNYVDPSARANDVCAGLVPVTATRTGNTSRPGILTISYTATDPSGNSVTSADTRTVTVSDTQLPTLELVGAATQRLECGTAYNEQGVRANDVCFGDLSSSVTTTGSVSPGTPADYTLVYDVTDGAGNRAPSVSRTMEVRDTLAPTLAVRAPFSQQVQCDHVPYEDPGATATDVCAGDLTGAIQRTGSVNTGTPGDYTLTYRVMDPSGNEMTATEVRKIKVVDDMPPTLQLVGPAKAEHECGTAYDDPGARASDVCAGDLTGNITRTGTVNPAVLGPYEILYTVTDPSNHTATTRREVSVRDTQPPSITCPEPIVAEALEGTLATVALGAATATDSCAMGEISGPTEKSFPVGTTDVKYTATDAAGNQASCTSTITVMAITLPGSPLDRALLGGGSGCSSTSSGPSALAMMGLAVLAALLARRR